LQKITIREALESWGEWARERIGTEIYTSSSGINVKIHGTIRNITDEEAMHIDSGVTKLKFFDETSQSIIKMHYIQRYTTRDIDKKTKRPKGTAQREIKFAEHILAGMLGYAIKY
jgi:hypothetical protein